MGKELVDKAELLVREYQEGRFDLAEFARRVDALSYSIASLTPEQEAILRRLVNRLEEIEFTLLPASKSQAVEKVVSDLRMVFSAIAD